MLRHFMTIHNFNTIYIKPLYMLIPSAQVRRSTQTRQSEMANTSPATCQCLATFTPLKSKILIFFRDVISLLARVFILLIDMATQEVPMKNIWKKLSVQVLRYAIELLLDMLNVAHVTNDVKWRPIVTTFGTLIENMSRTGLYDCHIFLIFVDDFMSNINCGMGVLHVKRQILTYFLWRHFSARSSFYCFIE